MSFHTLSCSASCNECMNYTLIYTYPSPTWKTHIKDWYLEEQLKGKWVSLLLDKILSENATAHENVHIQV